MRAPKFRYIAFHKPYHVVSQFSASGEKKTLKNFLEIPGVYPCGRLDYDSEGLLLLTDNGVMQNRVSAPQTKLAKVYWVQVEGIPDEKALQRLRSGIDLDGRKTLPAQARAISPPHLLAERIPPIRVRRKIPASWLEITLTEGRNRQIRRMTASVGYPTLRLIRWAIGPVTLEGLKPGEWRSVDGVRLLRNWE